MLTKQGPTDPIQKRVVRFVDSGLIVLVTTAQSGHGPFCSLAVLLSFVFKIPLSL